MKKGQATRKKAYRSIAELERALFPKSYAQQSLEKKAEDPVGYGSLVARELMDEIRKEMASVSEK